MKKMFLTAVLAMAGIMGAKAQFIVGGNIGLWCDNSGEHNKTTWTIAPEIGYEFNDKWEAGLEIGFSGGNREKSEADNAFAFNFTPYARYTFYKAGMVDFFVDGALGVATGNTTNTGTMYTGTAGWDDNETAFSIGVRPGVRINLNKNWSMISKIGFLGYSANDHNVFGAYRPGFGFSLSNALSLGLNYRF